MVLLGHVHPDLFEALAEVFVRDVAIVILIELAEHLEHLDLAVEDFVLHLVDQLLDVIIVNVFFVDVLRVDSALQLLGWSVRSESVGQLGLNFTVFREDEVGGFTSIGGTIHIVIECREETLNITLRNFPLHDIVFKLMEYEVFQLIHGDIAILVWLLLLLEFFFPFLFGAELSFDPTVHPDHFVLDAFYHVLWHFLLV